MTVHRQEDKRQKAWLWVGLLFFGFYFAEAVLFWGPRPRLIAPPFTPLVFWGLFGVSVIWVVTRPIAGLGRPRWEETLQSWVLGLSITAAAVGSAFLVIRRTGDITLGHVILLFALAEAGLVIGALLLNPGWFAAGLIWISAGVWVFCQPRLQDYVLGAAVAIGFVVIGVFRTRFVWPGDSA